MNCNVGANRDHKYPKREPRYLFLRSLLTNCPIIGLYLIAFLIIVAGPEKKGACALSCFNSGSSSTNFNYPLPIS